MIFAPQFLTLCVAALDRDPAAVMSITQSLEIDEVGNPLASVSVANQTLLPIVPLGAPAHVRFRQNIRLDHLLSKHLQFDPFRHSSPNRSTGKLPRCRSCLLAHLALFGHCVVIPKTSFFNRDHPGRFSRFYNGERLRERATWWGSFECKTKEFPFLARLTQLLRVVRRSPLEWPERLRCYWEIEQWLRIKVICDSFTTMPILSKKMDRSSLSQGEGYLELAMERYQRDIVERARCHVSSNLMPHLTSSKTTVDAPNLVHRFKRLTVSKRREL